MRKRAPNTTREGFLACAFGEPWLGPHYICAAATAAICGVPIEGVILPDFSAYMPKLLTAGLVLCPSETQTPKLSQGVLSEMFQPERVSEE